MSAAFVYLAYVQAAVYDALVSIEGGYEPYNPALLPADPTAHRDAAVAAAAYNVLLHYLPAEAAMLSSKYTGWLAMLPDPAVDPSSRGGHRRLARLLQPGSSPCAPTMACWIQ